MKVLGIAIFVCCILVDGYAAMTPEQLTQLLTKEYEKGNTYP